jgi:hypothetical protein
MKDKEIVSKGPKKRDPACLQVKAGTFSCDVGLVGKFSVILRPGDVHSHYKRVIA